jgi:hypothetical protein
MDGWIGGWMDGWIDRKDRLLARSIDRWIDSKRDRSMDG